ncbi:MAG: NADH-quinone oxidoreductase subunit A [Bacteroidetes bacterium]|nr:NADH-quinone oxidoreductase subunit A [Bacteroidota bacterium]
MLNQIAPLIIQAGLVLGFVVVTLFGTFFLSKIFGTSRHSKVKDENFECGIENQGDARFPVSVKYFLVAILFVLFDVEVIFFYPYAVNFKEMGVEGFLALLMFVSLFLTGFYYVIKKGALDWSNK